MSKNSALSKEDIITELWRRGNLKYKLDANQKILYDLFYQSNHRVQTWLLARRSGKSFCLLVLAVEQCLRKPNSIVKVLSPTKLQCNSNLRPLFTKITEDCPPEFKPEFRAKDYIYTFNNGSEIHLAGSDNGHAEKLRGSDSDICFIDEAGSCDDLSKIVKEVLLPTTLITKGKIVLASTPPSAPEHDFLKFVEEAELRGSLVKKTVFENPRLSKEQVEELIAEMGGLNTEAARRELLCVDEDTLVRTREGYKRIKNIQKGDEVFTHAGRFKRVKNVFVNPLQNRAVYKVCNSNNEGLICTEGHQLFIAESRYKKLTDGYETRWEKVEDIDLLHPTKRVYSKIPVDNTLTPEKYSEDLCYLIGWYLAEGHIGKNMTVLSLNYKDPIDEINRISLKVWGKPFRVNNKQSNCYQAVLCSKNVSLFYSQFGKGAQNKFIPYILKTAPKQNKIALLRGLFSGDGFYNIESTRAGLTSISEKLISDVSDILLSLGIPHQIKKIRSEGPSTILGRNVYVQDCFSISILGNNFNKFMELVYELKSKPAKRTRNLIQDGFYFSRIHRIEKIEYNKPFVYDIEVEDDHSYVSLHSTVHNCELIKDPTVSVIPEFTTDLEKEIVKDWPKPPKYDAYVSMDVGFNDLTVILFGYYDFRAAKIIIEDEIVKHGHELHLPALAREILDKEAKLWNNTYSGEILPPYLRLSDTNLIVISELSKHTGGKCSFTTTRKDDKEAAINNVRVMLANKKIIISPKCQTLIRHLRNVRWKSVNNKSTFARTADDGHADAVDALIYLVRGVVVARNPYPANYNITDPQNMYFNDPDKFKTTNTQVAVFKKIFGSRNKPYGR